jgi:hypothetical protein
MENSRISIHHTNVREIAADYAKHGFEPIECAFGVEGSVLGPLAMDHHGAESHREGVALRAYRDHRGQGPASNQYVVTGAGDADATFCIAALSGLLPDGLDDLAALVNQVDLAPIGVRLEQHPRGALLLCWQQLASHQEDALAFYAGVDRWRLLTSKRPPAALIAAALQGEKDRVADARESQVIFHEPGVAALVSPCWGFDVWYDELAPIVVALTPQGNVTVGCRDLATAELLLGPGGLKAAFPLLQPLGWGGRETVGGSPRGAVMTRDQAIDAAKVVRGLIVARGGTATERLFAEAGGLSAIAARSVRS